MSFTPTTQSFVLSDFSNNVIMGVSGELITEAIPILTSDATAIFNVSLAAMKNLFKYQSDASDNIITFGEFGIYFKSGDYFDLKNKIDNFLEKKSRLINFSRLNRKFLERFLEKKNFEEYLRIFKNI